MIKQIISQLLINDHRGKVVAFILVYDDCPVVAYSGGSCFKRLPLALVSFYPMCVSTLALGIAYAAVTLFDASFALGAFFAGMVLNESDLSHRAAQDALPYVMPSPFCSLSLSACYLILWY